MPGARGAVGRFRRAYFAGLTLQPVPVIILQACANRRVIGCEPGTRAGRRRLLRADLASHTHDAGPAAARTEAARSHILRVARTCHGILSAPCWARRDVPRVRRVADSARRARLPIAIVALIARAHDRVVLSCAGALVRQLRLLVARLALRAGGAIAVIALVARAHGSVGIATCCTVADHVGTTVRADALEARLPVPEVASRARASDDICRAPCGTRRVGICVRSSAGPARQASLAVPVEAFVARALDGVLHARAGASVGDCSVFRACPALGARSSVAVVPGVAHAHRRVLRTSSGAVGLYLGVGARASAGRARFPVPEETGVAYALDNIGSAPECARSAVCGVDGLAFAARAAPLSAAVEPGVALAHSGVGCVEPRARRLRRGGDVAPPARRACNAVAVETSVADTHGHVRHAAIGAVSEYARILALTSTGGAIVSIAVVAGVANTLDRVLGAARKASGTHR